MKNSKHDESTLRDWIVRRLAGELQVEASQIDLDAEVMSLGIKSLALIGLAGELAELTDRDLSAEIMWEHNTVRRLADYLTRETAAAGTCQFEADSEREQETVVNPYYSGADHAALVHAIQPAGNRTPLFLVTGAGGYVGPYHLLASHLGKDQPLYALRPPAESPMSVAAIAAALVEGVRTVQRQGPYRIGGFCFGGLVAFEMARQLVSVGQTLNPLIMFDIPAPVGLSRRPVAARVVRACYASAALLRAPLFFARDLAEHPQVVWRRETQRLDRWVRRAGAGLGFTRQPAVEFIFKNAPAVERRNIAALRCYQPEPVPCAIRLFQSRQFQLFHGSAPWRWRQLATGGVQVVRIAGSHSVMLSEPVVAEVADRLDKELKASTSEEVEVPRGPITGGPITAGLPASSEHPMATIRT